MDWLEIELKKMTQELKELKAERDELSRLQSEVEIEYGKFREKIAELEQQKVDSFNEMERYKKKFIELHFSFNETVESSVKVSEN